jgi:hypothetical protein
MRREKAPLSHYTKTIVTLFMIVTTLMCVLPTSVFADTGKTEVTGTVYEFDKDSHYEFDESDSSEKTGNSNTYGTFYIGGSISDIDEKSDIPAYKVSDGNLEFYYNYGDTVLNASEDEWHLVDDKSKKVNNSKLSSNILKGTIIIQTSKDKINWVDVETIYNAFDDTPIRTDSIYTTTDVQLINGCYYRVIVVYKLAKRTEEGKILFVKTDKYDYKKCAEIYEFYAYTESDATSETDLNQTYNLGSKVKTKGSDGYYGEETIDKNDIHYGWDLGNFYVSGYTDEVKDNDGNVVFLKNVGDKVTLWFKLKQNIDALNNDENLSITADTKGSDQYFETSPTNFGRGALIIRYTDYNNEKSKPIIYTNYLEANATVDADTKVQLFEEGDYEVALDYEVTSDKLIDKTNHYRIFFKFSVRNGNCMVYPFDVKTGGELTNSSYTENGFRLDLAKSRYLKINLKKEILKNDGLEEDTRFNGPAKDGDEYKEEGIYTITVSNEYTGQFTTKKIYVGTDNVLRAYMTNGLSIKEINKLVDDGATISDDGTIQLATTSSKDTTNQEQDTTIPSSTTSTDNESTNSDESTVTEQKSNNVSSVVIIGIVACVIVAIFIITKRKKEIKPEDTIDVHQDEEGGTKQ